MGYIQYGAAIGFAVAAGVGTLVLGLLAVVMVLAVLGTLFAVVFGKDREEE